MGSFHVNCRYSKALQHSGTAHGYAKNCIKRQGKRHRCGTDFGRIHRRISILRARRTGGFWKREGTMEIMTGLETKLDREAIRIQAMSRCLAAEVGSTRIFPEMYGLCILRYGPNGATNAIESLGGRASELLPHCEKALYARIAGDALRSWNYFNIEVDESCRRMVTTAEQYRVKAKAPLIGTLHILLGVLATSPDISSTFDVYGIGLSALRAAIHRSAPPKRPVEIPKRGSYSVGKIAPNWAITLQRRPF